MAELFDTSNLGGGHIYMDSIVGGGYIKWESEWGEDSWKS